jgi:Asp-tRNA(Asn)/Glu-tRNA(Gln) amidotransferase A subunit family amidase
MSEELCFLSAAELGARIGRKNVSPVEITRAVLARAERLQPFGSTRQRIKNTVPQPRSGAKRHCSA